jgi:hypothetical protein
MWGLLFVAFHIVQPRCVRHLFGTWMNQFEGKLKRQPLVGVSAFCCAIWLSRNDVIFNKTSIKTLLQVLYRVTHWLQFWSQMKRRDHDKETLIAACRKMEIIGIEIFTNHKWRFSKRIYG